MKIGGKQVTQLYDMNLEELKKYKPGHTRQHDFDDFWKETLEQLAEVQLHYKLNAYPYPVKGVKVYRISFPGFNHASMEGWLALPDSNEPCPGLVMFHGYNWAFEGNLNDTVGMALHGYASLQLFIRGQYGGSIDNVITSHGNNTGWMTKGILSPEQYYYRAVYMDCVRAVEILASMDEVDASRIGVTGGSQGGALTLSTAALSDIPKVAVAQYPFLSNFDRAIDIAPQGPYLELSEYFRRNTDPQIELQAKKTLSYFDIMNHAQNIKCHTLVAVGLVDDTTPPSTVFAAYNHMVCSKDISVFRYFGHEKIPGFVEKQLRTLMEYLG